jgi:hypothetical protein
MPDGTLPGPGGWNRIALQVTDLPATVGELHNKGARFRNDIVTGTGVRQILIQDPSGNLTAIRAACRISREVAATSWLVDRSPHQG